jgi:hypothetical protein
MQGSILVWIIYCFPFIKSLLLCVSVGGAGGGGGGGGGGFLGGVFIFFFFL